MKLNPVQWLWTSASTLVIGTMMLDVANVIDVPPIYFLLGATLLTVIGWRVMPSMEELNKAHLRKSGQVRRPRQD